MSLLGRFLLPIGQWSLVEESLSLWWIFCDSLLCDKDPRSARTECYICNNVCVLLAVVQQWQKEQWKEIAEEGHYTRKGMWAGAPLVKEERGRLAGSIGLPPRALYVLLLNCTLSFSGRMWIMNGSSKWSGREEVFCTVSHTAVYGLLDTDPRVSVSSVHAAPISGTSLFSSLLLLLLFHLLFIYYCIGLLVPLYLPFSLFSSSFHSLLSATTAFLVHNACSCPVPVTPASAASAAAVRQSIAHQAGKHSSSLSQSRPRLTSWSKS